MSEHVRQLRVTLAGRAVGRLAADARGAIAFAYEPTWLTEGFDIAPHTMAFSAGPQAAAGPLFGGLHGVFADSLPDGWGMLLMDRALKRGLGWERHQITLLDRLAYLGHRAMGALSCEPVLGVQDDEADAAFDLGRLAADAQAVLSGDEREVLAALYLHGGSPGGARPKVTLARRPKDGACASGFAPLEPGFEHWIVKFPAPTDSAQSGRIEYAYSLLAKKAGVEMPPTALIPVAVPPVRGGKPGRRREQHFFAVQRFDRETDDRRDERIHMLSLSGHLYATHRAPSVGYDTLLAATLRLTRSLPQVAKAFRLMAFNAVMHNRDDHTRNFAFLCRGGDWAFSPAYDLTFAAGFGGQHMSDIHGSGDPARADLLAVGRSAGIADPAAIVDEVIEAAGAWGRIAARCEVAGDEAKVIAAAVARMRKRLGLLRILGGHDRRHLPMNLSLDAAVAFALAHETAWPREPDAAPGLGQQPYGVHHGDPPPFNRLFGPLRGRGGPAGVVWRDGEEVAAWGDPERADPTFSVAKTYLALLAGVARARGLIGALDEPVVARLPGIGFDSPHNRRVQWNHLLEQTSEWEGSCFGLPDRVDRWRQVGNDPRPPEPDRGAKGDARPLCSPGTYWEYNDVRINQLALALLHLFRRPLPEVFAEALMRPLGATSAWRWEGYDEAWVEIDGQRMPSVPGGTHWGAGVSIGARDQARIAQLLLDEGWHGGPTDGRALLPAAWVRGLREPCAIAPFYGRLVWLNPGRQAFPAASEDAFLMLGAGGHLVWMEPLRRLVVVARWLDPAAHDGFMQRVVEGLA